MGMLSSMIKEVVNQATKNQIKSVIRAKSNVLTTPSSNFVGGAVTQDWKEGREQGFSLVSLSMITHFIGEKMDIKAGNLKS